MNEKTRKFINGLIFMFVFFLAGYASATIYFNRAADPSAGEVAALNTRNHQLGREYSERQRELENGVGECLRHVANARAIAERTGENAGRAIGNLTEASALIKQGIAERENLKMELDNLRARLYRLGGLGGDSNTPGGE